MAKTAIQLDVKEFQEKLTEFEKANSFTSRSALWNAFAGTEWAKTRQPRPLSNQVARLKADEFGLTILTPVGERGKGLVGVKRTGRRGKAVPLDVLQNVTNTMTMTEQEGYKKTLEKYSKGSLKAAIKLKCLDCSCNQREEVRDCRVSNCALFPFRPYQ